MLGCMASIAGAVCEMGGRTTDQVTPSSRVSSNWIRHLLGASSDSVLLPAITLPSLSRTGLFLMGPRTPSGNLRASFQVRPPSSDVRIIPHHVRGVGPTL